MASVHGLHTGFPNSSFAAQRRPPSVSRGIGSMLRALLSSGLPHHARAAMNRLSRPVRTVSPPSPGYSVHLRVLERSRRPLQHSVSLRAFALTVPVQGVRRSPLRVSWAFPVCAGAPDASGVCATFCAESSVANHLSTRSNHARFFCCGREIRAQSGEAYFSFTRKLRDNQRV